MQIIELTIILERSILLAIFTILLERSTLDILRKPLSNRLLRTAETLIWYYRSPLLGGFTAFCKLTWQDGGTVCTDPTLVVMMTSFDKH